MKPGDGRGLLLDRRFAPLFWCQAFAAFNDNFLKTALIVLILYHAGGKGSAPLVALAGAVFIAPFLIVSGAAGELADRCDKALIATRVKGIEIAAAALAVAGFLAHSIGMLFTALAAFGVLAALFGPIKYGLLPDLLETRRLPIANALVDAATFLAILLGTALGGLLGTRDPMILAAVVMILAILAWASARLIPRPGAARPGLPVQANPIIASRDLLRALRHPSGLWHAALVNAWFWFAGIVCLTMLPVITRDVFHRGPAAVTLGLTVFSLGIGAGSFHAARRMSGRISLAPAWQGTICLSVTAFATSSVLQPGDYAFTLVGLFLTAYSGGMIAVPSFAAVQAWSAPAERARAVAGTNILSAAAMVTATLMLTLLLHAGPGPRFIFMALGLMAFSLAVLTRRQIGAGAFR